MKEGKKESIKRLDLIPTNITYDYCDICNGELIKLETEVSEVKEDKYTLYWICLCSRCRLKVKVIEKVCEVKDYPSKGKYNDRSRVSGR